VAHEPIDLAASLEPYCRRDPVTGAQKCFVRRRHDVIHSPRLKAYHACIAEALAGRHYRGGGAAADTAAVRAALREAAHVCAQALR